MSKLVFPILFFILLGNTVYEHKKELLELPKLLEQDPAEYVLNSNIPDDKTLTTFQNDIYGTIELKVGNEATFGFRHILARHTEKYFINYKDKNNATEFPSNVSGRELVKAIDDFYEHCVDAQFYNRNNRWRNLVFVGFTVIDTTKYKCLMVINKEHKTITTFYPIGNKEDVEKSIEENTDFRPNRFQYD